MTILFILILVAAVGKLFRSGGMPTKTSVQFGLANLLRRTFFK
jgi:hypothetical protein